MLFRSFSPQPNEEVGLSLVIKGEARVFESTFSYRLRDEDGIVLYEDHAMANAPDVGQFGPFEVSVKYPKPKGSQGTVEVFDYSAKDGSEIDKIIIPVKFKKEPVSIPLKASDLEQEIKDFLKIQESLPPSQLSPSAK